jgi:hypothetical protein
VLAVFEILSKPPADFEPSIAGNGNITEVEQAMNIGSQQ